jgi:hypothetical protein
MPVRIPSAEVYHLSCIWFETRKFCVDAVRKDMCGSKEKARHAGLLIAAY